MRRASPHKLIGAGGEFLETQIV